MAVQTRSLQPLSRLPVPGACESAVLSALGVMARGQSRAQGGSAQGSDQGSEQPRQDAQSDSDMIDADAGQPYAGNADNCLRQCRAMTLSLSSLRAQ